MSTLGRYEETLNAPFALEIGHIDKVWEVLHESFDKDTKISAKAVCADKIDRTFFSMKELSKYENSRGKKILKLNIEAEKFDKKLNQLLTASIKFQSVTKWGEVKPYRAMSISINAPIEITENTQRKLLDIISGLSPSYHLVAKANFVWVLLTVLAIMASWQVLNHFALKDQYTFWPFNASSEVSLDALSEDNNVSAIESASTIDSNDAEGEQSVIGKILSIFFQLVPAAFVCSIFLAPLLNQAKKTIFPYGAFKLGQQERQTQWAEKLYSSIAAKLLYVTIGAVISWAYFYIQRN